MPFNIPRQDGSSIIVQIDKLLVSINDMSKQRTTIRGNSMFIIHFIKIRV
jgi:hypothetical protein